jgi:TonB-dependent receptor
MKIDLQLFKKVFFICTLLVSCSLAALAQSVKGNITDAKTGETLIGATVELSNGTVKQNTNVKLDGSYLFKNVAPGTYQLQVRYVGYKTSQEYAVEVTPSSKVVSLNIAMVDNSTALKEVTITEHAGKATDAAARSAEKNSNNTINAISAQSIAISPDVLVSNVLSRMSGISIDRSNTGDARHVIIRGMDKQYNTTLINGIKIPSPDNKNRYLPLDIFPAGLVDRLEVYKTLTPDMEGDASGGVVNLVMKSAPDKLKVEGEFGTGYSQIFFDRSFDSFDRSTVNSQSPGEIHPNSGASISEFPYQNLLTHSENAPINKTASLTIGNRYLDGKLGVMFAGSIQNLYQGDNSFVVVQENTVGTSPNINTPNQETAFQTSDNRQYSSEVNHYGAMASIDYKFNDNNSIKLFATYVGLDEFRVRQTQETTYGGYNFDGYHGSFSIDDLTQTRTSLQNIYNITLSGKHNIFKGFSLDWTGASSQATQKLPDMAEFDTNYNTAPTIPPGSTDATSITNTPVMVGNETREWEHNTDKDLSGYLNLHYKDDNIFGRTAEFSIGGMVRHKTRDNYQNSYTLDNTDIPGTADPELYTSIPNAKFQWKDLDTSYSYGSYQTDAGVYTFTENINAVYGMVKYDVTSKLNVIFGVREENTDQSYDSNLPATFPGKSGDITYTDLLPSINAKYALTDEQAIRAAYYKSVLRPSFYDLVPAVDVTQDDAYYGHVGNPYVQHTVIDNYDIRYEFFPGVFDEFMVGGFYKYLIDPIETTLQQASGGATLYYVPNNPSASAQNLGAEFLATKFFGNIGASVNYTYTNSRITTLKTVNVEGELTYRTQTRPLQGQAANIGNASLLYKDQKLGLDAQLSVAYTGERIEAVSTYYGLDTWERPSTFLDFSAQKKIGRHFIVYVKANNLLNTPYELIIKQNNASNYSGDSKYPHQESPNYTTVQYDQFYARYSLGAKYNF